MRTTMLLAQQSFFAAIMTNSREVTAEHALAALDMAMSAEAVGLATDIERLREAGRHALEICVAIARGEPPYRRHPASVVRQTIEILQRTGTVEQRAVSGRRAWVVVDPLFRRHLMRLGNR